RCGQYHVTRRWLGGTLTNWSTISSNIKILASNERKLERVKKNLEYMTKKEYFCLIRKQQKLELDLAGIRNMGGMPDLLFVVDINKEYIAVNEAASLGIPVVALVDTNTDPDLIKYPIPCNDDSIKVIKYCCENVANAVLAGIEKDLSSRAIQQSKKKRANISNKTEGDHDDQNVSSDSAK
ncbi:MAG: 30S ribosomal protein S2, partial [Candidatus Heimdallarchaeota archaeon]|nr:30S ribosomal protein S2 [Candidatus Heimdallarchaeota archaeon]